MKKFIFKSAIIISLVFVSSFSFLLLSAPEAQAQIEKPYKFQIEIPGLKPEMSIGEVDGDVIRSSLLKNYIVGVYNYSFAIAGVLAAIILMGGGVLWLISGGSPDKIGKAKKIIANSLIGLVLLFGSNLILRTINPELLAMKDLETIKIDRKEKDSISGPKTDCCLCTITETYKDPKTEEITTREIPFCKPFLESKGSIEQCAIFCKATQKNRYKDGYGANYSNKSVFTPNSECSKDAPIACIPNKTTVDVELVDGIHPNGFFIERWTYQTGIKNQIGDMSPELVKFLNCMSDELPVMFTGEISSISDNNNIGNLGNCNNKSECPKSCQHTCGSCHYGGGIHGAGSFAVDLGDEWNAAIYKGAAQYCCQSGCQFYIESDHVHISLSPCKENVGNL